MRLFALGAASFIAVAWAPVRATTTSNFASNAADAFLAHKPFDIRPAPASVLNADRAAIKAALLAGNYTSKLHDTTRMLCPSSCSSVGADSSHLFAYHDVGRLNQCNEIMLVDFSLLSELSNPRFSSKILACTADLNTASGSASKTTACHQDSVNRTQVTSSIQMVSSGASSRANLAVVSDTLAQLQASYRLSEPSCNETIRYAYSTKAAVSVYVGSKLASQGVIDSVLDQLSAALKSDGGVPESVAVQLCDNLSPRYSLGVFISTAADLSAAQHAVQTWKNGSCLATTDKAASAWHNITFLSPSLVYTYNGTATSSNATLDIPLPGKKFSTRNTCRTIQVEAGDSCGSLATECGITPAQFTQYNPAATECSTLAVGEYVCCSAGELPDNTPKPDSAGNCFSYRIVSGDTCSAIAASHDITVEDINNWNNQTWGWTGCSNLFIGDLICLSTGYPPMPAPIANAICGPQVNNTPTAPHGTDFSTLNECLLNACCDIWGQCGTTDEFCTVSKSSTGNPGTAAPGQNGCISNCGTNIISSPAPTSTYTIAYFEGFDWSRPCLNAGVQSLNASAYTHVHFGFAGINPDWSINTTSIDPQFPLLHALSGVKKIISIGGWGFCTDPSTYMIFRNVVASESSRSTLVNNIVAFMNTNNLDGVDIDWEYPDEPDIPGILPGTKADSIGFYLLLEELQQSIASNAPGKTISITAPASFWYLQHFPILALSTVVDYIVYMTYDLHGQWDYGRAYSDPGCPGGNCLRSHVNFTETVNALSMITKAGVPSNMVAVGVTSYARTFGMITAGCWTEMCTYNGPASGALPGPCTNTSGYLANYELDLVIAENPSAEHYWDQSSYSNILVYNQTQWGAYMNDTNKATRKIIYSALGFLGSSDWAVDLQSEFGGDIIPDSGPSTVYINPNIWASPSAELTILPGVTLVWPPKPLTTPTTISFPLWTTTVSYSSLTTLTSTLIDGSTSTYPWYIYVPIVTVITIPAVTTTEIPVWAVSLGTDASNGAIYVTSSVQPDPFPVTLTPVVGGTTSIINPTATSTISGGIFVWGEQTEELPPATETLGGSTTIIGGTTLLPVVITVTPNPHPTQTQKTPDPELNTGSTSWNSGGPPGPPGATSLPGCNGCGLPCILFCDPGCPFCPPGAFGNPDGGDGGDGGDGEGDDDNTSTTTTTSGQTATATVELVAIGQGDVFPMGFPDISDLVSLQSVQISIWNSENPDDKYGSTNEPTRTTTASIPDVTVPVTPTPTADCSYYKDALFYVFEVFNIDGWVSDGGSSLHNQESGCGALTGWEWHEADSDTYAYAEFNLPYFIAGGCVERAIVSAGGPKISCQHNGPSPGKKREVVKSQGSRDHKKAWSKPSFTHYTENQIKEFESFYKDKQPITLPHSYVGYVPMDWGTTSVMPLPTAKSAARLVRGALHMGG